MRNRSVRQAESEWIRGNRSLFQVIQRTPEPKVFDMTELADQIAGSSVLVTGASGFIGAHVCQRLLACHARVHAVSREPHRSHSEHLQWWQADLTDMAAVRGVFEAVRPEIAFHLASYVVGARDLGVVLPTFYDNLASTFHLLTAATEA
jgi:UDP-glucose 4-epimerase